MMALITSGLWFNQELSCYDVAPVTPGVAADLDHCSSDSVAKGYGADDLLLALEGADLVVIPAGVPRKPGMSETSYG